MIITSIRRCVAWLLALGLCVPAWADGMASLERFLKSAKSGRAEFTQVVTSPAREGQPARTKTSTGSFEFSRPDRFRFVYRKPFEQIIVADGKTLWLHDVDLNQVTARKQADVLGNTPAGLLAAAPDLRVIEREFALKAAPDADGKQWLVATPKAKDGQVQSLRVGFVNDASAVRLAVLEIQDNFGQRSVITFDKVETNPVLPPGTFEFKPPTGADVVR